ncbi:MAG: hypothetical protein JWN02_449 [Acidobacteria bacterium]|nr:hypothetical protein [Acidobacteriota bacterium]
MKRSPAHVYRVMSKTLEIPDTLYEELEKQAEKVKLTVPEYARLALIKGLGRVVPPMDKEALEELLARLRARPPLDFGGMSSADIIREGREERDEQLCYAVSRRR